MSKMTRRSFVGTTAMGMTALSASRVHGANSIIRTGFIGIGGRGGGHVNNFGRIKDVEVAGLCDPDEKRMAGPAKKFDKAKTAADLRRIIEDKDIDAVVVSTCNHWHVLASIWAIEAGKHVYVEKPVSHNIWEGRQLVKAARKHNRIVQGGTQQRSDPLQQMVKDYFDSGEIGKIKWVRCNRYGKRGSIGKRDTPLKPPEGLDYNLWLGPAQDEPMFREKFHYDWHWIWNTGNGDLGNWGPHITDDLRNVVFRDKVKYPSKIIAGGGRFKWNDAGESPNTHFCYMDCGGIPVIIDVHNMARKKDMNASDIFLRRGKDGKRKGYGGFLHVECEGGFYNGGRGGGAFYDSDGKKLKGFKGNGGGGHAENFIKAIRSGNWKDLNADVEEIHYSSAWCHLGNISYRLGGDYERGQAEAAVKGIGAWTDVIDDFHTHLEANEIDLKKEKIALGPLLEFDAKKETFVGPTATPKAKALVRREYRKGFEVTETA